MGGYVAQVLVQENQVVKQGNTLVRLDTSQYQALLDQAKGHAMRIWPMRRQVLCPQSTNFPLNAPQAIRICEIHHN
ncbi:biotin/lipoyl-binding protein [Buttiauxella sp. B2]|uniref:biotin/lipoyl-binding protein n=1 Tax=Buttiauxella sp. B2 TaxID=2587812 RepID=UPI001CB8F761